MSTTYFPSPLYSSDSLDESKLSVLDIGGVATRCYVAGSGRPIVFIHGGNFGSIYSLDSFSLNLPWFAERFQVIAFDKLGQGFTGAPAREEEFTYDAVVDHARGVIEALDLSEVHLVGHSRGGPLVAALAFAMPDRIRSITVVDSGTLALDDPRSPHGAFYTTLPPVDYPPTLQGALVEPFAQAFHQENITEDFGRRMLEIAARPENNEILLKLRGPAGNIFRQSVEDTRTRIHKDLAERGFPVPTQVVWGNNDLAAPTVWAYPLFELIARHTSTAQLSILNQSGHYSFREQPEAFNSLVAEFSDLVAAAPR